MSQRGFRFQHYSILQAASAKPLRLQSLTSLYTHCGSAWLPYGLTVHFIGISQKDRFVSSATCEDPAGTKVGGQGLFAVKRNTTAILLPVAVPTNRNPEHSSNRNTLLPPVGLPANRKGFVCCGSRLMGKRGLISVGEDTNR